MLRYACAPDICAFRKIFDVTDDARVFRELFVATPLAIRAHARLRLFTPFDKRQELPRRYGAPIARQRRFPHAMITRLLRDILLPMHIDAARCARAAAVRMLYVATRVRGDAASFMPQRALRAVHDYAKICDAITREHALLFYVSI